MFDSFVSAKISVLSVAGERNREENGPDAWLVTTTAARSLFRSSTSFFRMSDLFLPDRKGGI